MMMGRGDRGPYEKPLRAHAATNQIARRFKSALNRILETGCLPQGLRSGGLLDFRAVITTSRRLSLLEAWRATRIRFYHRQDGKARQREPLGDRATSAPANKIQVALVFNALA